MPQYYSLNHIRGPHADEPFGIIRQAGHSVQRYIPGDGEWVEAPSEWDYLLGNEPGARQISEAEADALIARGKLAPVSASIFAPKKAAANTSDLGAE